MTDRKESPSKESAAGLTTAVTSDEHEEKFRCSFCAQIFASRKEVLVHEWQHKERQTFSCTVCSRSFTNKNLFDRHVAVHNKLGQRGSLCNICNKTFRNHRELDKHHQKDHKGQKSFRCGICGLMYSWMDNLQKHMRVHVDKPIGCFRCHKSFRDEESFNQHTLVHKREDVEKRAQGLPITPSTPETEDVGNIITIGMPGNLSTRIPARTNVINITPVQQKDIPIATNVMSLAKSAIVQHNTDKPIQGAETKTRENDVESAAVLDLTDPQQMAALLEGYINDDPLTSTAETMDMISALSVDTSGTDSRQSSTEPNTVDKLKNKSPNKIQKDSDKPSPTSTSPKQGVKTITYTLAARSSANTVTSSTMQQSTSVTRSSEMNLTAQTLSEGTNQVILNGTLKRSNLTVVSAVVTSSTGSLSYTSTNSKHADCGTGPMSATETKLLEQIDKPHKCHVCGECFKYEFTLNAHMPKHKEALPAWESRGVLVPYGAGVKSVVLPKAMPIKPYGCPVCQETFRYDSCLKAHFMKSHPSEYKEKFGVDPKVIQALNVPNPRFKRPYHRKTVQRPDAARTEKQTPDNQNSKPKVQVKTDKEKIRKKIDGLVIETPKPVVPKSKKDRLRPMPPHLLKEMMEAQEAKEKEEKERIEREEVERERKRKEEEERQQREEEERQHREEEEKRKAAQEKTSPEKIISGIPAASQENTEEQLTNNESEATTEMASEVQSDVAQNEQNSDISIGKPLFIVPLFNAVDVSAEHNIAQPAQCTDTSAPILVQNNKPNEVDMPPSQDFSDRKLETTTIDLSQLKEVTTPIIEEVLHKSPFKTAEIRNLHSPINGTANEKINNAESHLVIGNEMETDQPREKTMEQSEIASTSPSSPERTECDVQSSTNSEVNEKNSTDDSSNITIDNIECNNDKLCTTPKKSSPKSKKPKTPKPVEPVHRILTRRKYAYDEETRFRAEREAAEHEEMDCGQREENTEIDNEDRVNASPVGSKEDEIVEPQAMEITCESKETDRESIENDEVEAREVEQISDQVSDITNRDMGTTDQVSEITNHDMGVTDHLSEITNRDKGVSDQVNETTNHDMEVSETANHDMRVTDQVNETANHEIEATDCVDVQSIQSESANSAVSMVTAKTSSEDEATDIGDVESHKTASAEPRIENAQSVKSDVQSENGLETIVIIFKDSEMNSKNVGESEQLNTPNSIEDANKKNSVEEWVDKTGGKEDTRSRKGKHMRDLRNTLANGAEEQEPRILRRTTRSANEPKEKPTEEQKEDGPRVLRKRTKDNSGKSDDKRKLRSSPQKDALHSGAVRTLRRRASPVSVEKSQKCSKSKSHEDSKDTKELKIKLKRCIIPLVPSIIPPREKSSDRKSKTSSRDSSVDDESNYNVRSRLRKRQMSTESVEESQKTDSREKQKSTERTLRRRLSTESVESKDGSVKSHEPVEGGRQILRRRLSANSLDSSRSRSSSCPRRLRDPKRKPEIKDREDESRIGRQLRKRLSPEREKEKANTDCPGRSLRSNSQPSNTERKAHTLTEKEGKRSQSENIKSPRKLRSTRSSSWEEQAKALTKCSVKLLRCDTPVKQLDTADKENIEEEKIESVDTNEPSAEKMDHNESEIMEKEDAEKDPLLSVLEKETQLVLKHIQREKETMEAARKEAQMEIQSAEEERIDEVSEKDSADTVSLEMSEETDLLTDQVRKEADSLPNNDSLQPENENVESGTCASITEEKTDKVKDPKESKESRKPKKSRSKKKGGNNIYELIRQQKDQIQTKVLGKSTHDISPKEKRGSPDSKKSSPELKKVSSETKQSPEITNVSTVQSKVKTSRKKKDKKRKKKSRERKEFDINNEISVSNNNEVHVSNDRHIEKEIGIIIPVENVSVSDDVMKETSSKKQASPTKTKKTWEEWKPKSPEKNNEKENGNNEDLSQQISPAKTQKTLEESKQISGEEDKDDEDSDDNEDLNQLLELATGRTLRSEVQKSPTKDQTKHIYPSALRQNASDFERAVHLSLLEAQKSRKEKKKKKKHKRDKRDSSPFTLPESCYHSVKTKKKKKKKHKHREREKEGSNSNEEKLLDLSEEQVELLEQSFELMMPDLFRQLTIQSPTNEVDQPFPVLSSTEAISKKEKKSSPSQNKSPSHNKQHTHKKNGDKSPARDSKSPRNDDKKLFYSHEKSGDEELTGRPKSKTHSPKSPKPKKAETPPKSKTKSPVLPEALTRTTRAKHAKYKALEFQKQIQKDNPLSSENALLKTSEKRKDRKANRKAEKEKKNKKEKQGFAEKEYDKGKQKETHEKQEDRSQGKDDRNKSRDKPQDKRDKYDKRRDYEKRPRTENLFLQDISQTPKFFEHNIPLTNSLSQVPSNAAPIAPVQFPTLTDPSRKRTLDSLLSTDPHSKSQTGESGTINSPPAPKRKRGRPPKASKVKQNAPQPAVPVRTAAPITLTQHIPPVFGNPLSSNVFGSISGVENPANTVPTPVTLPKEKSNKKGKKRKRDSSGRIEIRGHEIVYMEEKGDSTSENSLGAEVGGEDHVMDEVEIKQEVESSEAEDGCTDSHMHSNEVEEGREVIMVSVATMTDSSYLMDLRRLMLEQEQMEAEAAAAAAVTPGDSDREPNRTEPNSPRLTVKLYRCDYCTRPFTQRSWMVLHKLREHGYSCQSQAIYMHTLARRVIRRVLIDWRRHGCEACNRRFNHKAHYIFHRSSEHRRKQYRCGVCNLTSDSYLLYQMHAVVVHKAVMIK